MLFDIMTQAQNAINALNIGLQNNAANIAQLNTPGYKRIDTSFQTIFNQVITNGTPAGNNQGGTNPKQFGGGMTISGTSIDLSNGEYTAGSGLDLGIYGSGFFILSPDGGNSYSYSRSGNFQINSSGNLTSNGYQVYGLDSSGIVTPITGLPSGNRSDYQWLADGTLQYSADNGTTYTNTGYRIALTYFPNPAGLLNSVGTTFLPTVASGSAAAAQAPGGATGSLKPGQVEQSNVSYTNESITALQLQRAMTGDLTMLKMASDLISSFIQKLG